MPNNTTKSAVFVAVFFVFFFLAACGGGGGGGGGASVATPAPPEFNVGGATGAANVANRVAQSARSTPRAGSATQSSNNGNVGNATADSISVAVQGHPYETPNNLLTSVVGNVTWVAAHRRGDEVRVWLNNRANTGKLATLGISLNPACPEDPALGVNYHFIDVCVRYIDSAALTAVNHANGGYAVIATTGQTPVVIDGQTVATNYHLLTVTSSNFRRANIFTRTPDNGNLYARIYSDAVLSPSASRAASYYIAGAVTIINSGNTLLAGIQDGDEPSSIPFYNTVGVSLPSLTLRQFVGQPGVGPSVVIAAPPLNSTISVPVTLRSTDITLSTTLTGPRNGGGYRSNYLAGGFWIHAPANATRVSDYEFGVFADGSEQISLSMIPQLTGVAVYSGEAAGVYASSRPGREEVSSFQANAMLTANFDNSHTPGEVSGRVSDFVLNRGVALPGAVELSVAEVEGNFFQGDTGGEGFSGKWGGNFYGNPTVGGVMQPDSVGATFGGATNDNTESIVGFVGARIVLQGAANANFVPPSPQPLKVNAGDVWEEREVKHGDNFFAVRGGGKALRAAGVRLGALEIRRTFGGASSRLPGGGVVAPFFAANDGRNVQMRLRFGGGFSGFAANGDGGDGYRQVGVLFERGFGRVGFQSSFSRINEDGALLGGKWGEVAKLRRGGESMQARAKMTFAAGDDVQVFAAAEQLQTRAATGGIISRINGLRAFGWHTGAAAEDVFRYGDRLRFGLTGETAISDGVAILRMTQTTPGGLRIVERAAPLASAKHRTISAAYGFTTNENARWSFAAARRIGEETRAHLEWRMKF